MSEAQVDSVVKSMFDEDNLIRSEDINEDYAPLYERDFFNIYNSAYEFRHDTTPFYIEFTPEYLSGRLVALFCVIIPNKHYTYKRPIHKIMADIFQNSERGKTFKRVTLPYEKGNGEKEDFYYFIKDNLEVSFYHQGSEKGTMHYHSIPDEEALSAQKQEQNNSSKEF